MPLSKSDKPSVRGFPTPDDASDALAAAVNSGDQIALQAIFGPDAKEILSSGDVVQDRNDDKAFTTRYEVRHRWRSLDDGTQVLLVGADDRGMLPLAICSAISLMGICISSTCFCTAAVPFLQISITQQINAPSSSGTHPP